jgi:hypothetical protein
LNQEKESTMEYIPPQVINVVDAQSAIQGVGKFGSHQEADTEMPSNIPGYEGDE